MELRTRLVPKFEHKTLDSLQNIEKQATGGIIQFQNMKIVKNTQHNLKSALKGYVWQVPNYILR